VVLEEADDIESLFVLEVEGGVVADALHDVVAL